MKYIILTILIILLFIFSIGAFILNHYKKYIYDYIEGNDTEWIKKI